MRLLTALLPLATLGAIGPDAPKAVHPVVVELFTSQGCSSCPPADAFVEDLAKRPDIVAITRPVTYWDRLGWKDTLASEDNTQLQRAYAKRGGEGSGVYTPQTMVQGAFGAVGSDRAIVRRQIETARVTISLAIAVRPGLIAIAGEGPPADVKLIGIANERVVRIGNGENSGKTIRYSHVIVSESVVGRWKGKATTFAIAPKPSGTVDRWVVLVQQQNAGKILAARYL